MKKLTWEALEKLEVEVGTVLVDPKNVRKSPDPIPPAVGTKGESTVAG